MSFIYEDQGEKLSHTLVRVERLFKNTHRTGL